MKYCYLNILLLLGLLASINAAAQESGDTLITGHFQHITFEQFVYKIESSAPYRFYYNPKDVDSLQVNISVKDQALPSLLDSIFEHTSLEFAIDRCNRVFITKGYALQIMLPAQLFKSGANTAQSPEPQPNKNIIQPEISVSGKPKPEPTTENKLMIIGIKTNQLKSGDAIISGYVRDSRTDEPLSGVVIQAVNPPVVVVTDQYGYFTIKLPTGHHTLIITALGMFATRQEVMLYSNGTLNIGLKERVISLKAVQIYADKSRNVKSTQMGVDKMTIQEIKQIPAVFGEVDIMKAVLALPGVLSVGEAGSGFNVRGGATDQNLVLLNGNTIYNPSHFFGFFSAFDPDVVKNVELYKSNIPAQYGGRLSSVLDVTTKEGNKKKLMGSAGIGLLTGKVYVEGPLIKNNTSFIAGFRTTYSDWMMRFLPPQYRNARASFDDATIEVSSKINNKNNLYLTGYMSNDQFNLASDTTYAYQNRNGNIKWKRLFNDQFYGVFTACYDHYQYNLAGKENPVNAYQLSFGIDQYNLKTDFTYDAGNNHTLNFGIGSIYYKLYPGAYLPVGKGSLVIPQVMENEQALQSALYLEDHFTVTDKLAIDYGIRYSLYNYLGPKTICTYPPSVPREVANIQDTIHYPAGKNIQTYQGPDFRVSVRYLIPGNASLKASFNSIHQYIHMLSNTTIISPTDIWKLSDPNIKPEKGYQVSLGFYKNFKENTIETSVEVYYKRMKNYPDYKNGAVLIMNPHIETDLINTSGLDYGIEMMIKKTFGKLNGWFSYTYSRALLQTDDPLVEEPVNEGKYYPSSFDKPNSLNLIGNYRLSHRFSISLNVVYSTGRPITLPVALYDYGNSGRVLYSDRNQYRIPDYFRTDFSMNIEGNANIEHPTHNSWTLGIYNLLGRKNPYSVYFVSEGGSVNGYKLSIFGSAIPFVTYNIRF
jgi:hypothetical protein